MEIQDEHKSRLMEVAKVFFKLGCTAFGGPAVHIAMMEKEVVSKRKWMTKDHFLDLVGATNLIPGPNSTEMTMHCGHERAGLRGLFVAGVCFISPAVFITGLIGWAYYNFGKLPNVQPFIYGITPAIISVIVFLMIGLGRKALKSVELGIIGLLSAVLVILGYSEIGVLFGAGFVGMAYHTIKKNSGQAGAVAPLLLLMTDAISNLKLFLIFLKIGAILYGSGYVLFAFLEDALVTQGLLTKQQLVDAIAVGQFTPGPVFSSATFIGWQIAGFKGALVASLGIFLPSFAFVALLNPLIPKLRSSEVMSAFLDAVNIASIAIILAVVVDLGSDIILDWRSTVIALLGFGVAFFFRNINTAFIILGGGIAGYVLTFI